MVCPVVEATGFKKWTVRTSKEIMKRNGASRRFASRRHTEG